MYENIRVPHGVGVPKKTFFKSRYFTEEHMDLPLEAIGHPRGVQLLLEGGLYQNC